MRATQFEFQQRFWIIGLIFWMGFGLYWFDHTNFAVALLHLVAPSIDPDSARGAIFLRLIFGAGALLVFFAAAFRTWATAYLRTEVVHDASLHSEAVVADGPYRNVRNPLYLANLFLVAGVGTLANPWGWLFMVVAMWLFVYRLILREEEGLLREHGGSYAGYLKAVPRFWPSLTPRTPSGESNARWGQAFAGESLIWLFGLAVLTFALTLNVQPTCIVFGLSFAVYFLALRLVKRRAARS